MIAEALGFDPEKVFSKFPVFWLNLVLFAIAALALFAAIFVNKPLFKAIIIAWLLVP